MSLVLHPVALVQRGPVDVRSLEVAAFYEPEGHQYKRYESQDNTNTTPKS